MIAIQARLPFWLAGPEALKLAGAAQGFWVRLEAWLAGLAPQADIRVCSMAALALHAAYRGVTRLPGEPQTLGRARVLHALTTAVESGSRAGLELILATYGVQNFSVAERVAGLDWDVVVVELDPDTLSADTAVLDRIFAEWGRVCRRYQITHTTVAPVYWIGAATDELQHVETAA
jgi:hypothetical protein